MKKIVICMLITLASTVSVIAEGEASARVAELKAKENHLVNSINKNTKELALVRENLARSQAAAYIESKSNHQKTFPRKPARTVAAAA